MKKTLILSAAIAFLAGCAHHKDVRPGVDGMHRVVIQTEDPDGAGRDALSQANHFCKETKNSSAAIVNEGSKYTGSMDESSYRQGKTVAKVAQAAGGAAWVFGGKNERAVGGIAGIGGGIADGALGKGYTFEMKFKCL